MGSEKKPLTSLLRQIRELILAARKAAVQTVDHIQVATCFEIGRRIVDHEQQGAHRAEYGKELIRGLATSLTDEFGPGFSKSNLEYMRRFYLMYKDRHPAIAQTASGQLSNPKKAQTLSGQSAYGSKSETPSRKLPESQKRQLSPVNLALSWSHYIVLMGIKNPEERSFYEIEVATQGWAVKELKRQFNSGLYERLALSRDKDGINKLARKGHIVSKPQDLLKEPLVLEFLGLNEKEKYSETDLESAIIDKLEHFLLELGKGFLFEARQKRFL
jgi:predicted nuclease of restriction endonuclease-like (RecB) superfamily